MIYPILLHYMYGSFFLETMGAPIGLADVFELGQNALELNKSIMKWENVGLDISNTCLTEEYREIILGIQTQC